MSAEPPEWRVDKQFVAPFTDEAEAIILYYLSRGLYNIDGISKVLEWKCPEENADKSRLCFRIRTRLNEYEISSPLQWDQPRVDGDIASKVGVNRFDSISDQDLSTTRILNEASPGGESSAIPYADGCY